MYFIAGNLSAAENLARTILRTLPPELGLYGQVQSQLIRVLHKSGTSQRSAPAGICFAVEATTLRHKGRITGRSTQTLYGKESGWRGRRNLIRCRSKLR